MRCRVLQEHHIQNHMNRYIESLTNTSYLKSIGYTKEQADKEIAGLWERRRQLQQFDEIKDGKRQPKVHQIFFGEDLEEME